MRQGHSRPAFDVEPEVFFPCAQQFGGSVKQTDIDADYGRSGGQTTFVGDKMSFTAQGNTDFNFSTQRCFIYAYQSRFCARFERDCFAVFVFTGVGQALQHAVAAQSGRAEFQRNLAVGKSVTFCAFFEPDRWWRCHGFTAVEMHRVAPAILGKKTDMHMIGTAVGMARLDFSESGDGGVF